MLVFIRLSDAKQMIILVFWTPGAGEQQFTVTEALKTSTEGRGG